MFCSVAVRDAIGHGGAGFRSFVQDFKLLGRARELTRVVTIDPLDLAVARKQLEGTSSLFVAFVPNGNTADQGRPEVFQVHGVFELVDAVLFTFSVCDQVVSGDNFAPFLGLAVI